MPRPMTLDEIIRDVEYKELRKELGDDAYSKHLVLIRAIETNFKNRNSPTPLISAALIKTHYDYWVKATTAYAEFIEKYGGVEETY